MPPTSKPRKKLRCILGFHNWKTFVNDDGGRYLKCIHCGKYGDKPDIPALPM